MAIAIQIDDAFDIETYDGLIAYVTAHLELDTETAARVPNFIRKGEYRLNRLVIAPERETSVSLTTVAAEQAIDLPADFRQLRNARLVLATGGSLKQVSPDALHDGYTNLAGSPTVFAITEQAIQFGPIPDAVYTINLHYLARLPSLSATTPTNWLLSTNADAYVYSALWQACAWMEDLEGALAFRGELMTIIEELNMSANRYRNGGPLAPRVLCVP